MVESKPPNGIFSVGYFDFLNAYLYHRYLGAKISNMTNLYFLTWKGRTLEYFNLRLSFIHVSCYFEVINSFTGHLVEI